MKPNTRSISLVLAAVLLTLFWIDRGVYRTWVFDKAAFVQHRVLTHYLHHPPVIWPGLRYWDWISHKDDAEPQQPEQILYEVGRPSDQSPDLAQYAYLATQVKPVPHMYEGSRYTRNQLGKFIAVMKKGEQIDPTNALYNLLQSQLLLHHSMAHVARPANQHGSTQGSGHVVTDSKLFHEGIRQFQVAQKKQLRLYEYDRLNVDFDKLPTPLLWEHYEMRRAMEYWYGRQIQETLSPDRVIMAAQFYIEKGDPVTARKLLDIKAHSIMMLTDKQASEWRQNIASEFGVRVEAMLAGRPQGSMGPNISPYPGMPVTGREFLPVSHRAQTEDMARPWIGWDAINIVLQQQAVWVWLCFGMAVLVVIACIRDLVWWIVYRVKRKSVVEFVWPHQPVRLALGFAGAAVVLTVAQMAALHIWADDVTSVWRKTQYVAPLLLIVGWISVRFEFMRNCQLQRIPVPSRWAEMMDNWLPVAGVIGIYATSVYLKDTRMDLTDRSLLLVVASCLIMAAIIPTLSQKYRIQDYYILANRETRRFLAWMVVFISISVMPLQILHEVVLLRSDRAGIGAFRSVEMLQKLDQAANREYIEKIDGYLKGNSK